MALVTICKYRRAKTPYFLEQAGLNMYSLEELAWFLYHNICLAEPQMFDDRLCRWLEEEIGSSELARRIRNGKESGTNFQNLVISIVGAVDLFTNQELAELEEQLQNCQLELGALESYLKSVHPEQYICGLTAGVLARLLCGLL